MGEEKSGNEISDELLKIVTAGKSGFDKYSMEELKRLHAAISRKVVTGVISWEKACALLAKVECEEVTLEELIEELNGMN